MDELDSDSQTIYNGIDYHFLMVAYYDGAPQIKLDGALFDVYGYQKFRRDRDHPYSRLELIPNGGRVVVLVGEEYEDAETVLPLPGPNYPTGIINVKAYGAKGDGVTNDAAAIQAAFTAALARSARVYFPGGIYIVNASLSLTPTYFGLT